MLVLEVQYLSWKRWFSDIVIFNISIRINQNVWFLKMYKFHDIPLKNKLSTLTLAFEVPEVDLILTAKDKETQDRDSTTIIYFFLFVVT